MSNKRTLTPLEKNFLKKHGFDFNQEIKSDIPVEYILNQAEFRGLDFYVTTDTLIPRIETEALVEYALKNITHTLSKKNTINILDLCTGSGCIGISIGLELEKIHIPYHLYLSDISEKALIVAQANTRKYLPENSNVHLIKSDLFNRVPKINFDLIVSNPPYIPTRNIYKLENSVKNYEPILALDGGPDGTTLINKIITALPSYQKKVNCLIEIDDTHNLNKIKSEGLKPSLLKDQFDIDRFIFFSS